MKTQRLPDLCIDSAETFEESPDPSLPGTDILGKYTVVRRLGQGGMGMVVAARHHDLGGLFAIKFLLPGTESDQQTVGRFVREAKALSRLRGEHLVRVHDVGRLENGSPYMVMEYLEGQNLKSVLRHGPIAIEDAVTYLLQICDAITEAHDAGIVHRDLKPANLYLTKRPNGTPCMKVLDFGISKLMADDATDLTGNHMIGSLRYMSPEQIKTPKSVDARTDIWALGLIACEFFAAKLPFNGQTQFDIVTNILDAEPEPPSTWRRDLPAAIEAVILRCLRKNPTARFQSVRELSEALRVAAGIVPKCVLLMRGELSSISVGSTEISLQDEPTKLELSVTDISPTVIRKRSAVPRTALAAVITIAVGASGVIGWQSRQRIVVPESSASAAVQPEINGAPNAAMTAMAVPSATSGDSEAPQVAASATASAATTSSSATVAPIQSAKPSDPVPPAKPSGTAKKPPPGTPENTGKETEGSVPVVVEEKPLRTLQAPGVNPKKPKQPEFRDEYGH